jgi:thiamine biosynthesis protein ThiS
MSITVTINGKQETTAHPLSVSRYLQTKNIDPAHVVVEKNRTIVKREKFGSEHIEEGDSVEILQFVGGG